MTSKIPLLAFVVPFLIFISFPSRFWNFDGVACAAALELGNPIYLFHSNHLLYGFLGFLFWKVVQFLGVARALPALQLFTSLLAAGGFSGLFYVLQKTGLNPRIALGLVLCAALSAVGWVWSIEAQVYALGFFALAWATYWLIQPEHPRKWYWVGALHAAAILGHIVHALWIAPALYWLYRNNPRPGRKLMHYFTTLAAGVLIPYALVIGGIIVPRHWDDRWLIKWLMGSASLNPTSLFEWHFAGWSGPLQWAHTTLKIFWGSFWPYETTVPVWAWLLTLVSGIALAVMIARSFERRNDLWRLAALWLVTYGVFFWTWEPRTECYRFTDWIPIALMMSLGLQTFDKTPWPGYLVGILIVSFFAINLRTRIGPMSDIGRNRTYQETRRLAEITPDESIYLTAGGSARMYLLYFWGRSAWDLHAFQRDPNSLHKEIVRHALTRVLFIRTDALQPALVEPWIRRYQPIPLGDLPWLRLK